MAPVEFEQASGTRRWNAESGLCRREWFTSTEVTTVNEQGSQEQSAIMYK
jgi:hypothetical protein